ncbi:hypothetical protein FOZ63_032737 [Perkinsus olseni]|uniref:Phospholipid-transporting ATPase n=1 Tax=Perkinsus olseni TaxID=32597 RepID=A0A7J6U761_PEROL|nr:hypothetical protein FOZ63_032737 [Perkinsus olseni]
MDDVEERSDAEVSFVDLATGSRKIFAKVDEETRYRWWNFLPTALYLQFRQAINLYFLVIIVLRSIPSLSSLKPVSDAMALFFVVSVSILREGLEDFHAHKEDDRINSASCFARRRVPEGRSGEDTWQEIKWMDVQVGDVLLVYCDEAIPADMVVLSSSSSRGGEIHIQTASLDGETTLKAKFSPALSADSHGSVGSRTTTTIAEPPSPSLTELDEGAFVTCGMPIGSLDVFHGVLKMQEDGVPIPLSADNFVPRDAILKNAEWFYGMAVYTGPHTKVMVGQNTPVAKVSKVQRKLVQMVLMVLAIQILMCLSMGIGNATSSLGRSSPTAPWYIAGYSSVSAAVDFIITVVSYIPILQSLVPLSLMVTLEMVRLIQSYFIGYDTRMRYMGQSAVCRTTTINEDLGQVGYIFSDKTGTLTANELRLRAITVGHVHYGGSVGSPGGVMGEGHRSHSEEFDGLGDGEEEYEGDPSPAAFDRSRFMKHLRGATDDSIGHVELEAGADVKIESQRDILHHFANLMATCHSVTPEARVFISFGTAAAARSARMSMSIRRGSQREPVIAQLSDGWRPKYAGESPDECCLVEAAAVCLGYKLVEREQSDLRLELELAAGDAQQQRWRVEGVVPFTNERKRSTVIVYPPGDGQDVLYVYTKGADDVMLGRLSSRTGCPEITDSLVAAVNRYSHEGFRTLIFAMKAISRGQWQEYKERLNGAALMEPGAAKDALLAAVHDEIESDLTPLGCTGMEDRLQDHVPEAIIRLKAAGIRVCMITGDKLGTAIEIARTCGLIKEDAADRPADGVVELGSKRAGKQALVVFDFDNPAESCRRLKAAADALARVEAGDDDDDDDVDFSIVISGRSLGHALDDVRVDDRATCRDDAVAGYLTELLMKASGVVVCRATKEQKSQVVSLVMDRVGSEGSLCLAIGDGANDVPMLNKAHVGIAIFGKEGMAAVQNADFAIAQFWHLTRMLLVHGRLCYLRISKLASSTETGTAVVDDGLVVSGATLYDEYYLTFFNLIFTSIAPFLLGVFDRDASPVFDKLYDLPHVPADVIRRGYPKLYYTGRLDRIFRSQTIVPCCIVAFACGFICYGGAVLLVGGHEAAVGGLWLTSVLCYSAVILLDLSVLLVIAEEINLLLAVSIALSLLLYIVWLKIYSFDPSSRVAYLSSYVMGMPSFYLVAVFSGLLGVLIPVAIGGWYKRHVSSLRVTWQLARYKPAVKLAHAFAEKQQARVDNSAKTTTAAELMTNAGEEDEASGGVAEV